MKTEQKYQKQNNEKETPQEKTVREILIRNKIPFIRQKIVHHPRGFYLLDFMIRKPYRIALEIDGKQHLTTRVDYDVKRTIFLELDECLKVVRFRNDEVSKSADFESTLIQRLNENKIENRPLNEKEKRCFNKAYAHLKDNPLWKRRMEITENLERHA